MNEYGCLESVVMSFYSSDFYQAVYRTWGEFYTFLYLFSLIVFLNIIVITHWQAGFIRLVHVIKPTFISITEQVPDIIIKHGEAITPEDRPYFIPFHTPYGKSSIIIDTSGKYIMLDENISSEFFTLLLTKTTLYFRTPTSKDSFALPDARYDIKPKEIRAMAEKYYQWIWVPLLIYETVSTFLISIASALIGGLIGLVLLSKMSLCYFDYVKLYLVSMTPCLVVAAMISTYCGYLSYSHWAFYLIELAYFYFAVLATQKGRF